MRLYNEKKKINITDQKKKKKKGFIYIDARTNS